MKFPKFFLGDIGSLVSELFKIFWQSKAFVAFFSVLSLINSSFQSLVLGVVYLVTEFILKGNSVNTKNYDFNIFDSVISFNFDFELSHLLLIGMLLSLVSFFLSILTDYFQAKHVEKKEIDLRMIIIRNYLEGDWKNIIRVNHGFFVNLVSKEAELFKAVILCSYFILNYIIQLLFFVVILFSLNELLFLYTGVLGLTFFLLFFPILSFASKLGLENSEANEKLTSSLINITKSVKNIKIEKADGFVLSFISNFINKLSSVYKEQKIIASIQTHLSGLITILVTLGTFYLIYAVLGIKIEIIVVYFGLLAKILTNFQQILDNFHRASSAFPSHSKIQNFLKKISQRESRSIVTLNEKLTIIELKDITIGLDDKILIENLSMTFLPSKIYSIEGKSGIGKTTFLDNIIGILEPLSGSIIYNNMAADKQIYSTERISYLTQNHYFFNGTLKENLFWGINDSNITKDYLDLCLKTAAIEDFIHNKGFNFDIEDGGNNLSGGEKQRIALARILLKKNSDFLLLDEPTSALDDKTEKKVLDNLKKNFNHLAIIIVSHKLQAIEIADVNIRILGNGKFEVIKKWE